jgi:hypothetical protein
MAHLWLSQAEQWYSSRATMWIKYWFLVSFVKERERERERNVDMVWSKSCNASNVNPSGVFLTFPSYDKLNAHVVDIELLGFQFCRWMCPYPNPTPTQPNPSPQKKGQKLSSVENKGTQRLTFYSKLFQFFTWTNLQVQYYEIDGWFSCTPSIIQHSFCSTLPFLFLACICDDDDDDDEWRRCMKFDCPTTQINQSINSPLIDQ